jgi:hypothetical protein
MSDADGDWFPGKHCGKTPGPEPLLTREKRRRIAESAMTAKKKRRVEPCVAAVVVACPEATRNPETGKPFSGKTIRRVFNADCYDFASERPWKFQPALQKVCLPDSVKAHRFKMARLRLASCLARGASRSV